METFITSTAAASIASDFSTISGIVDVPYYDDANNNTIANYDELEWLNKKLVLFTLLAVYLLVIVGGVLGNGSILMTLFTSGRVPRNSLLVALCLSDFLVSGISAPITVINSAFVQNSWRAGSTTCKTMYFFKVNWKRV